MFKIDTRIYDLGGNLIEMSTTAEDTLPSFDELTAKYGDCAPAELVDMIGTKPGYMVFGAKDDRVVCVKYGQW